MAGIVSTPWLAPYGASKFAVVAMSEALAMQLKPLGIGVTVLCPGFVRSRIMQSERNRPERYGPKKAFDPASPTGVLFGQFTELVQSGLDPSDVARRVLAAIHEDELYVFTHPQMRDTVEKRFATILAAMDKAAIR
jgi:short-subunit dehydrogenase